MASHSSTLAWKIPWMEGPGGLQSLGLLRVGHDWATSLSLFTLMHYRRKWQPTPVFLPGESQGRGSLVGWCLWGRTEYYWSDLAAAVATKREREIGRQGEKKRKQSRMVSTSGIPQPLGPQEEEGETQGPHAPLPAQSQPERVVEPGQNERWQHLQSLTHK